MQRNQNFLGTVQVFCIAVTVSISICGFDATSGQTQSKPESAEKQTAATPQLSFEVASIKPSQANPGMIMMGTSPGGRYTASGVTLMMLVQQAYDIRDYQITGAPGWASSDRYDIVAKAENPNSKSAEIKLMLQSLLAERFNLKFHRETKDLPIYILVVGKNGPKLQKSELQPGDAPQADAARPGDPGVPEFEKTVGRGAGAGGNAPVIIKPGVAAGGAPIVVKPGAGAAGDVAVTARGGGPGRSMMSMGRGTLNATAAPLSLLVQRLAQVLGQPVVDKTGLTGNFDYSLQWTPSEHEWGSGPGGGEKPGLVPPPAGDSSGPSIFVAVQEQLGLKLESQKGPVDVYVIESVAKPSGN